MHVLDGIPKQIDSAMKGASVAAALTTESDFCPENDDF
jgi:hypothetical protein